MTGTPSPEEGDAPGGHDGAAQGRSGQVVHRGRFPRGAACLRPYSCRMSEVNGLLRAARERTPSRRAPGEHMSRAELAEAVCAWLWETTKTKYDLDGHYIAKLERGAVRWPGAAYRSGLRQVLNVASDN